MIKYARTITGMTFAVLILFFIFSCGKGEYAGYNAPEGSIVTVTIASSSSYLGSGSLTVAPGTTASLNVRAKVTGKVTVLEDEVTPLGTPMNNIQVVLTCINCTIYDQPDDDGIPNSSIILADTPLVIKNSPYVVKTNGQGFYPFVIVVSSPADIDIGEGSYYLAAINADIGVSTSTATISVGYFVY